MGPPSRRMLKTNSSTGTFRSFGVMFKSRMISPPKTQNCQSCGVKVEEVPWASGKHQLTKTYMQFLAHWARKLSWKETAESFFTTWEKVCHSVE